MRVLLISANTERLNMPTLPLGLGMVASVTATAGHEVRLLDLLFESDPLEAVRSALAAHAPDVIGISVRNIDDQNRTGPRFLLDQVRPVVEACRAGSRAPVVLGGAGYSLFPDEVLAHLGADFGIRGDGERRFVELLACLEAGREPAGIAGLHRAGSAAAPPSFSDALDQPPPFEPTWRAVSPPDRAELWVPVQSRRGCPNDCSYCATAQIQGRAIRTRAAPLVGREIARLVALGFKRIYLVDNAFNMPEAQGLALCRELEGLGAEWRCILYPHRVSADLVETMARAGCVEVALGFESGNERVLRALNKRFSPDEVRSLSALLARRGIRRMGFLLLGGPGETRASVEESLRFAESLRLDGLRITAGIRIYPGTALHTTAIAEGVVAPDDGLLLPRFYLAPGLEDWIDERLRSVGGPPVPGRAP